MLRGLILVAAALIAVPAASAAGPADEIASLRRALEAEPDNLEIRLALARRLSWAGDREAARREAEAVSREAPRDADAQLLLARLDAWDGDYDSARRRLAHILAADPRRVDALALAADVELWAGSADAARRAAADLVAVDPGAGALFRRARAAALSMRPFETRRWALRVLGIDPRHRGARRLLDDTRVATISSSTEIEIFPAAPEPIAFGQTIRATLLPGGRWSASLGYEYRRRFATDNHLALLGVERRFSRRVDGRAFVRAGRAEVIPEITASATIGARVGDHYRLGLGYRFDKMPWPGHLHRAVADAGVGLPAGVELSARYFIGALRNCGATDLAQGVTLRGRLQRGRLWVGAVYAFGMELEQAPLPPFLEERFGDAVCQLAGDDGLDLIDTRATSAGAELGWSYSRRFDIRGAYIHQYRHSGDRVHISSLGLRLWL